MTRPTPPALYMSAAAYRPPGRMSAISGVRSATSVNSSSVSVIPNSAAIAGRWSAALVLPPVADTDAIAFSSESRVTMSAGRMSWRTSVITSSPARRAASSLAGSSAGMPLRPRGRQAEELAHRRHRVGGELAAARAGAGAGALLDLVQLLEADLPGPVDADRLVHGHDVGGLRPCRCPGRSCRCRGRGPGSRAARAAIAPGRDRLVAADEADDAVEQVAPGDELDRVRDDLAADRARPSCPRCPSSRRRRPRSC